MSGDWLERVKAEKEDLDAKEARLAEFIETATFENLRQFQRWALHQQLAYMRGYRSILLSRIEDEQNARSIGVVTNCRFIDTGPSIEVKQ